MTDINKQLIRDLYSELHANGRREAVVVLVDDEYVDHDIPGLDGDGGRDELLAAVFSVRDAFPDITPRLDGLIGEGDLVSVRVVATGHHTGASFMGIEPSGKPMRWTEQHQFRCRAGKIVEHWGVFDMLAILHQLGVSVGT